MRLFCVFAVIFPAYSRSYKNLTQSAVGELRCEYYASSVADNSNQSDFPTQLQGQLLLAGPSLREGTFRHSVILLAQHQVDLGAFGLILNHPTGKTVGDFLHGDEFASLQQLQVHHGGPVAPDQLPFSAFWWSKKYGLRWAIRLSADAAVAQARRPGRIVRAYIGYSGWTAGQLENELRHSSWVATDPQPGLLGKEHDGNLWFELLRQVSPLHRILAEAPDDPSLN